MERGFEIPRVADHNTMSKGFDMPWVGSSTYHGWGLNIPWIGGSICSNNISGLYIIQAHVMFQHFGWLPDNANVRGSNYYVRTLNTILYYAISFTHFVSQKTEHSIECRNGA